MAEVEVKESAKEELSEKVSKLLDEISGLTVLELTQLVKACEDKFGVSAAPAAGMMMPMAGAGGAGAAEAEEKTSFDVVITSSGDKKIQVIKVVRSVTDLGLKEAKDLVDNLPGTVKKDVPKEEAEKVKAQLEESGATVELK